MDNWTHCCNVYVLVHYHISILEHHVMNSTIGEFMLVKSTFSKHFLDFCGVLVDVLFSSCHIHVIHVFGSQQACAEKDATKAVTDLFVSLRGALAYTTLTQAWMQVYIVALQRI